MRRKTWRGGGLAQALISETFQSNETGDEKVIGVTVRDEFSTMFLRAGGRIVVIFEVEEEDSANRNT